MMWAVRVNGSFCRMFYLPPRFLSVARQAKNKGAETRESLKDNHHGSRNPLILAKNVFLFSGSVAARASGSENLWGGKYFFESRRRASSSPEPQDAQGDLQNDMHADAVYDEQKSYIKYPIVDYEVADKWFIDFEKGKLRKIP